MNWTSFFIGVVAGFAAWYWIYPIVYHWWINRQWDDRDDPDFYDDEGQMF